MRMGIPRLDPFAPEAPHYNDMVPACVYLAAVGEDSFDGTSYFKLGRSTNPRLRVQQTLRSIRRNKCDVATPPEIHDLLQTHDLYLWSLWWPHTITTSIRREKELHQQFEAQRVKVLSPEGKPINGGEWYLFDLEIMTNIANSGVTIDPGGEWETRTYERYMRETGRRQRQRLRERLRGL